MALQRAGHEVELFAARTDELEGSLFYPVRSALRVATGLGRSPLKAIQSYKPDVIHIQNLFPNFSRRWVFDTEIPILVTVRNYRPLCANGLLFRGGAVCTRCPDGARWSGIRFGCYRESRLASLPLAWTNRRGPLADPLLARADRIRVLTQLQQRIYERAGLPTERMTVLPNFLPDDLDPGREAASNSERSGWVFAGRLSEEKGLLELIKRWPHGERLVVLGDGPQRDAVHRAVAQTMVTMAGQVSRRRIVHHMRSSVGLVFPSLWYEPFGLVYVEALACGLPVLAIGDNAVAEQVEVDETGWRVTNTDDLPAIISEANVDAPALRDACRRVFETRYTERAFITHMNQLFVRCITRSDGQTHEDKRLHSRS